MLIFTYAWQDAIKMTFDIQELAKPLITNSQYDHTLIK